MGITEYRSPDELRDAARSAGEVFVSGAGPRAALVTQFLKEAGVRVADGAALTIFAAPIPDAGGFPDAGVVSDAVYDALAATVPVRLDFMCPGFAKCGTTTLQQVLALNPACYLPPAKETFFLQWYKGDRTRAETLRRRHYRSVESGQVVGDIDPSHYRFARDAREYFGPDMKLIFMLRNPADAEYSYFRMIARYIYHRRNAELFRKHRRFGDEMFRDYIACEVKKNHDKRFLYDRWISEFLECFPSENVKIVLFEDLLKNPGGVLDGIQEFLGMEAVHFDQLPHANEGKRVSRGFLAARINYRLFTLDEKLKPRRMNKFLRAYQKLVRPAVFRLTLKDNDDKLDPETRKILMAHFMPSICRLEKIMGRSLEGVWY